MRARDNPFAVDRLDRLRFRLLDDSWDALWQRLENLKFRASVVGPHGSGKTTLLGELTERLQSAGHRVQRLRLNEQQPSFPRGFLHEFWRQLAPGDIVILDGAEQLSRIAWWRFRRRSLAARGLIVTSHRPGLLPTLVECRTNRELLVDLLQELLGGRDAAVRDEAARLYDRHGGNIREVWRALYDQCAEGMLVPNVAPPPKDLPSVTAHAD
jgi:hypothetical protein